MFKLFHERHGLIEVSEQTYRLVQRDKEEWVPQRTPDWYAKRQNHITASIVASIVNENPYESRASALKKKTGCEPPFQGSSATEHGNKYESVAIRKYEEMTGEKVIELGLLKSLNGEKENYLAGSPDGITASGLLIEVKCPFRRKPIPGEIPAYYQHQIQFLMHILCLDECDFIQYVPGSTWIEEDLQVVRQKRCEVFWARIEPMLLRFWHDVQSIRTAGTPEREPIADEQKRARKKPRVSRVAPCLIPPPEQEAEEAPDVSVFLDSVQRREEELAAGEHEDASAPLAAECLIPLPDFTSA